MWKPIEHFPQDIETIGVLINGVDACYGKRSEEDTELFVKCTLEGVVRTTFKGPIVINPKPHAFYQLSDVECQTLLALNTIQEDY